MSVLVVGMSHRTGPVDVLERLALDDDGAQKLIADLVGSEHVSEAVVVSTCNRVEAYVGVDRFHGSVEDVSRLLAQRAGADTAAVVPHLFVHYDEAAVAHLFSVAAGLDSMVVGESQILGQIRGALRQAQDVGSVGPTLNVLFQQALRVGKRGHAETDIDRTGPSVVAAALDHVEATIGPIAGRRSLVVGAGSMASLAVAGLNERDASDVLVVNRTQERAEMLAADVGGQAAALYSLPSLLPEVDVVVSCTGATGVVIDTGAVAAATRDRGADRPYAVVDLAMPHDVEPSVADLPGVVLVGLDTLVRTLADTPLAADAEQIREIVASEVAAFLASRSAARVTPTVVALRTMATEIVAAELDRLEKRLPDDVDPDVREELHQTVRRVADKLLHAPTVRIKELAERPGAVSYADALADLFSLDPGTVDAVTRADVDDPSLRLRRSASSRSETRLESADRRGLSDGSSRLEEGTS
ncbi:MAG TPA: glutamyl-tRNA reductase [Nocardioidaceae bacterium]|nr:glutamyl-tRNA reductase [Nocardioidaceae bacterium]